MLFQTSHPNHLFGDFFIWLVISTCINNLRRNHLLSSQVMQVELQELYVTFLFLLVALFLQELARRITQPFSKLPIINYFDFVRYTIFCPYLQKEEPQRYQVMSIVVFTFIEGIFYMVWLAPVLLFATSIPKVPIQEVNVGKFLYFTLQFWVIFFIPVSVFLPYWLLGWLSLWKYERRVQTGKAVPYQKLLTTKEAKDGRDFHKKHFALRVKSWLVLFGLTLIVAIISLFPLHS